MTADERRPVGGAIRVRIKDQRQGIDTREAAPAADDSPKLAQNRIWCAIVALAVEITAWMQMLTRNGHQARRWEPKRLRLRLFTLPATIARTGRQVRLHLATKAPWSTWSTTASGSY